MNPVGHAPSIPICYIYHANEEEPVFLSLQGSQQSWLLFIWSFPLHNKLTIYPISIAKHTEPSHITSDGRRRQENLFHHPHQMG